MRRIGLNLLYLVPGAVGGTEIYARRLVDALARHRPDTEFLAFAGVEAAPALARAGWPGNVRVHRLPVRASVKPLRIAAEWSLLPAAAARSGVELLHSVGTTSPPVVRSPSVVTVHDLIYEHFPQTFPAPARAGLKALVGPGARRATRVHAISAFTKRDVVERLRVPAERVDVVHNGFGAAPGPATAERDLRARFGLGERRVVLCVSAALAHKNLPRLIDAFASVGDDGTHLVLAGHAGRERDALLGHAARAGVADRVTLTGWIEDADLEGLYALATCCAYPSLFEGFGMPALEAMARDRPLACSTATSLPEVTGDAAELFDPASAEQIAAALRRLLTDPARREELVAKGRERVAHFTWERCAAGVWEVYERASAASATASRSPAST